MFAKEYFWRDLMTACGLFVIVLTIGIGGFLVYKGSEYVFNLRPFPLGVLRLRRVVSG